ncbi:MAG: hypothetical protein KAU62_06790, partial [Candidatus Heimdallarchaeota archaeon]|nr:hypothetical protein [Candidatus Heimdallarchaeota archaeon]MCK4610846.1 hypothetical protein [Candidatus Heimdallarchaeota archaeon]
DQSIVDVECIWTIPGLLNDSINSMTNIQGTNIWTTSITTSDLPENKNVVVTIRATDTNGEKAILYSGFFINDGSPPVLYGIKDLRKQTLCHTSEHTLYVYVNDTSEIDYVLIHLWIANGTQYYSNYTMIKGGGQIFYYTIDNSHFDISVSTWITYRFEARDIHGYSIQSDDFTFYVGDLTGPAFKDFFSPEIIGYQGNPIFKVKLDDENGSGIQSVSLVFSDDGWITNSCLTLDYDDNNWWKAILPELNLLITREYYFSAIDWYNNPSQSYISNYTSEDIYQPKCVSWKLNDGNPINDTVSTIHIEVWLEDPNGFKTSNVNFTFNSLKENQNFNYTLEHVSANYFHLYINYNWIGHDFISYRFETEDLIGNIGQSNIYSFTVSDTLEPNIDPNIAYSGGAWKNDQSDDEDPNNIYADAWLLDFQQSFVITTTVEDDTLTEVRLYYGTSESSFSSYVVMNDVGSNQFEGIISSSILTTIYTSSSTPAFTYELLFLKIWAEDNASHVEEFYFWDDDNICFELYDFTSPILSNFIIPSTSDTGTYPLFKVDAEDYKAIADAHIRFRYSDTTTSWYDMTLESGDYFDGTWKYNSWQVPTNFDGVVYVDFEFTDRDGKFYITYWQCTDTDKQTTTNSDYNFTARDATAPTILDHYVSPNEPEYNEQFRFYVEVTDSLTGLDNVWIEWWKDDVKQNNLSLSLYLEDIFRSDLLGTYEYNTKIQYIAHAIDNRGNEAYTSQLTFHIEDTVDPIISNVYHTPNPITETNNYVTVYATVTDAGAGVDYVTVKWYKNGYYQYNQQMNYIGNNQWSYDIYV